MIYQVFLLLFSPNERKVLFSLSISALYFEYLNNEDIRLLLTISTFLQIRQKDDFLLPFPCRYLISNYCELRLPDYKFVKHIKP